MPEPTKLTYWERWAITRQSGIVMHMIRSSIRFFVLLLFLQVIYQLYLQNYTFQFQFLFIPVTLVLSLFSWLIHEYLFKQRSQHPDSGPKN